MGVVGKSIRPEADPTRSEVQLPHSIGFGNDPVRLKLFHLSVRDYSPLKNSLEN